MNLTTDTLLYKYLPPARVDVLDYMRIRFTQPSALNDPYECVAGFDFVALKNALQRKLAGAGVEAPHPPVDVSSAFDAVVEKSLDDGVMEFAFGSEASADNLRKVLDQVIGVLSLSKTPVDVRMWSLYADGHTGFCLGLRSDSAICNGSELGFLSPTTLPVRYLDDPPLLGPDVDSRFRFLEAVLGAKAGAWSSEQEVRVLHGLERPGRVDIGKDPNGFRILLYPIPSNSIASVIFGARASGSLQETIRRYCQQHECEVHYQQVQVEPGKYSLRLVDLA